MVKETGRTGRDKTERERVKRDGMDGTGWVYLSIEFIYLADFEGFDVGDPRPPSLF